MVERLGFEPRLTESKAAVLPLNDLSSYYYLIKILLLKNNIGTR